MARHESIRLGRATRSVSLEDRVRRGVTRLASGTLAILLFEAAPLHATDGVLEINQACATSTGCFAGDPGGFPVTISVAGAYVLTGDLSIMDPDTPAIEVTARGANLDLRGHTISGPVSCSGRPSMCTPAFRAGHGIYGGSGGPPAEVTVANGDIRGMGGHGIWLGDRARVRKVRSTGNGWDGIQVGVASQVVDCDASSNASNGIGAAAGAAVDRCTADNNNAAGIDIAGGRVSDSIASGNQNWGIRVQFGGVIEDSIASSNGGEGIRLLRGTVSGSTAYGNGGTGLALESGGSTARGNTATANAGAGILCEQDCVVLGNTTSDNTGYGIVAPSPVLALCTEFMGYGQNVIEDNAGGTVEHFPCSRELGTNLCSGDTTCP